MRGGAANRDRQLLLLFIAGVLVVVIITAIFAPAKDQTSASPTTYNNAAQGARAAYLLLPELGYSVSRFEDAASALDRLNAAEATLVLAEPDLPQEDFRPDAAAIERFLKRGGRVVATGAIAAQMLPEGRSAASTRALDVLCETTPEGMGGLAQLAPVRMSAAIRWSPLQPAMHVEQRCGQDAVVVSMQVGQGVAVWWASPDPLTNRGLRDRASLALLLASIGDTSRRVYFDEFYHGVYNRGSLHLEGLPLTALSLQALAVFLLLLWSYSRRPGPSRPLVRLHRTSPLEFARSMGSLYQRAGATDAPIECARQQVLDFLESRCGLPSNVVRSTPEAITAQVEARFGIKATALEFHLRQSEEAGYHRSNPKQALALVRALRQHIQDLNDMLRKKTQGENG